MALDASKLTGGKAKGVAEFEFSTPKLRFSYTPCWLQQSDDLKYYVLVGETVSSDYAADDYVEQRLKIKGPGPIRRTARSTNTGSKTSRPAATKATS